MRALLLLAAVGVAACGGTDPAAPAPAPSRTSVAITFDLDGEGGSAARTVRLRCPSPRREAACRALSALPRDAFAPPPAGQVCTEIYGGPETARIIGVVEGRRVDAVFARTDGCQIARFERVAGVLRVAGRVR